MVNVDATDTQDLTAPEHVEEWAEGLHAQGYVEGAATLRALSAALEAERAKTADGSFYQEKDIDALQADREILHKAGIVEIAARNPNVMEYIKHWKARAEAAQADAEQWARKCAEADHRAEVAEAERDAALNAFERQRHPIQRLRAAASMGPTMPTSAVFRHTDEIEDIRARAFLARHQKETDT